MILQKVQSWSNFVLSKPKKYFSLESQCTVYNHIYFRHTNIISLLLNRAIIALVFLFCRIKRTALLPFPGIISRRVFTAFCEKLWKLHFHMKKNRENTASKVVMRLQGKTKTVMETKAERTCRTAWLFCKLILISHFFCFCCCCCCTWRKWSRQKKQGKKVFTDTLSYSLTHSFKRHQSLKNRAGTFPFPFLFFPVPAHFNFGWLSGELLLRSKFALSLSFSLSLSLANSPPSPHIPQLLLPLFFFLLLFLFNRRQTTTTTAAAK